MATYFNASITVPGGGSLTISSITTQSGENLTLAPTSPGEIILTPTTQVMVSAGKSLLVDTILPMSIGAISIGSAANGISSPGSLIVAAGKSLTADSLTTTTLNAQLSLGNANGGILSPGNVFITAGKTLGVDTIGTITISAQLSLGNATGGLLSPGTLVVAAGKSLTADTVTTTTASAQLSLGNATGGISSLGTLVIAAGKSLSADALVTTTAGSNMTLTTTSTGYIKLSRQPFGDYTAEATQSISSSVLTQVVLDTTNLQKGMTRSGNVVTIANAGVYTIYAQISWNTVSIASRRILNIVINGLNQARDERTSVATAQYMTQNISIVVSLSASSTVSLEVFQDTGGAVTIGYGPGVFPKNYLKCCYVCD